MDKLSINDIESRLKTINAIIATYELDKKELERKLKQVKQPNLPKHGDIIRRPREEMLYFLFKAVDRWECFWVNSCGHTTISYSDEEINRYYRENVVEVAGNLFD